MTERKESHIKCPSNKGKQQQNVALRLNVATPSYMKRSLARIVTVLLGRLENLAERFYRFGAFSCNPNRTAGIVHESHAKL
jgi:hypothetical protein